MSSTVVGNQACSQRGACQCQTTMVDRRRPASRCTVITPAGAVIIGNYYPRKPGYPGINLDSFWYAKCHQGRGKC